MRGLEVAAEYAIRDWRDLRASSQSRLSRCEREAPARAAEVCGAVWPWLLRLPVVRPLADEDAYQSLVAKTLAKRLPFTVERAPKTPAGDPDLLIHGTLALEVKRALTKQDRCVGQCAGYAKQWPTWIILFETPPSRVQKLEQSLIDHGFNQIIVIPYY
jgi:hypothetical protein